MKTKFDRSISALLIAILVSAYIFQTSLADGSSQPDATGKDKTVVVAINLKPAQTYTPPKFCPTAGDVPSATLFFDDFESGIGKWTFDVGETGFGISNWEITTPGLSSGTHSLYGPDRGGDDPLINYANDSYAAMKDDITISSLIPAYLYFNHKFDLEADGERGFDGGVLEYSTNHGSTWQDAQPLFSAGTDYNAVVPQGYGNFLENRPVFSNTSGGMVASRYDLSSLSGPNIRFRWRIGTDYRDGLTGWYVDDVRIYTCVAGTFIYLPLVVR